MKCSLQFGSVQSLSHVQLFATSWTAARQASLSITNSLSLIFLKRSLVFPILLFSSISLHWGRLSYLSLLFFGTLPSDGYIFPFLLYLSLLFFSQLSVRPPQTTILPFCIFFSLGIILITASYTMSRTSVHSSSGTLSDLIPWIYLSLPLYNYKGFDLGYTWMV